MPGTSARTGLIGNEHEGCIVRWMHRPEAKGGEEVRHLPLPLPENGPKYVGYLGLTPTHNHLSVLRRFLQMRDLPVFPKIEIDISISNCDCATCAAKLRPGKLLYHEDLPGLRGVSRPICHECAMREMERRVDVVREWLSSKCIYPI